MRDDLAALAHKYRHIARLRRDRAAGGETAPRDELRALARAHPGALNELDRLPLEIVEERAGALEAAASGGAVLPWMEWMIEYHSVYRAALHVRTLLGKRRGACGPDIERIAERARAAGFTVDADFVRAVASPPRGRIRDVVLDRVARRFGIDAAVCLRTLFPFARAARHSFRHPVSK